MTEPSNTTRDEFADLTCIVTGASSGIGRATAQLFLERGATVVAVDRDANPDRHARLDSVELDVSNAAAVEAFAAAMTARLTQLDVLVNAAGISPLGNAEQSTEADWDSVLAVNVKGPWLMTKFLLPLLRQSDNSAIVNVASGIGLRPVPGVAAYAASKAALISLTQSTVVDFGHEGIRANCVCPGPTDTPLMRWAFEQSGRTGPEPGSRPNATMAEPSEQAEAIALLASPLAKHIVGSTLAVDGGRTLH